MHYINKVAVIAICKDELGNIAPFIDSVYEADAIFILDTGSTDGSYSELCARTLGCQHLTVKQQQFTTINYAEFRNAALDLCLESNKHFDYILWLDLDERVCRDWRQKIDEHTHQTCQRYRVYRTEHNTGGFVTDLERLFKHQPGRWIHTLHEGWVFDDVSANTTIDNLYELTIDHFSTNTPKKLQTYQDIVEGELLTDPTHYLYFYLLHFYSTTKDYRRYLDEYANHAQNITKFLSDRFQHLLLRYALLSTFRVYGVVEETMLNQWLGKVRNRSTLFYASYLWDMAGQKEKAASCFEAAFNIVETEELKFSAYIPSAYDPAAINQLAAHIGVNSPIGN